MMSVKRATRSVFSLFAVLGAAAFAAPVAEAAPHSRVDLPNGVFQTRTGRYLERMCKDVTKPHCLGNWLLPAEWKPGMALPNRHDPQKGKTGCGTTAPTTGMGPTDITTAYNIPSTASAGGKIVAIVDIEDGTALADVQGYRTAYGLPAMAACTGTGGLPTGSGTACFAQVDSLQGTVIADPTSIDTDADGETALDMAMISAACPDCSILLVAIGKTAGNETGDNGWQPFIEGVATAKKLGASAVSISFGGPENTDPNIVKLQEESDGGMDSTGSYTVSGMPVFVASGDFAYDNQNIALDDAGDVVGASPSYPSSAPDVISVGGTMLIKGTSGYTEAVWDDGNFNPNDPQGAEQDVTTSGCSTEFAMPAWQAPSLAGTSCTKRATADVAAAAAYSAGGTSEGIVLCDDSALQGAEGTSAASPMIAGMFTRIGITQEISTNLGWIYESPMGFNDLGSTAYPVDTTGNLGTSTDSNLTTCGKLCTAGPGWDGPSGMGTPNATVLATLTANPTPIGSSSSSGGSSSGSSSGTSNGSSNGTSSGTLEDASTGSSSGVDSGPSSGGFSSNGGSSGGGCAVTSGSDDSSNLGLFGASLGFVVLLGARRRRSSK